MADQPMGTNMRLLLTLAVALLLVVVVIWMLTGVGAGEEETVTTYEAGATDVSGGELIVTDPDAPGIEDLELPETAMTPVPPAAEDASGPAAE